MKLLLLLRAWYWEVQYFRLTLDCMTPEDYSKRAPVVIEMLIKAKKNKQRLAEANVHNAHEDLHFGSALPLYFSNDLRVQRRQALRNKTTNGY